jgi:probable phosphoglycerate mutase
MPVSTRLVLVRHGATQLTAEDRYSGDAGVELSDEGRRQAQLLAERLAVEPIAAVYCSPSSRARDTAALLAEPHQLTPIPRDGLREISHGHWEGMIRAEVEERYPEEYGMWEADPFTFAPAGGETGVAVLARALPVIREVVLAHAGKLVLLVSHKGTLRLILSSLLGFDARGYRDRLDQAPACLNILDFKDPVRARLTLFNDTSHYSRHPASPGRRLSKWWDPK